MRLLQVIFIFSLLLILPLKGQAQPLCTTVFGSPNINGHVSESPQILTLFKRMDVMAQNVLIRYGFKDLSEFHKVIQEASPFHKKVSDILTSDQFEFAIMTPYSLRGSISDSNEFKNQYETGHTQGGVGEGWQQMKEDLEAHLTNTSDSTYRQLSFALRPKYGFGFSRHPSLRHTREALGDAAWYGDDIFVFKKANLQQRTSFYIGDSWNSQQGRGSQSLKKSIKNGREVDQQFLPWSYRDFLVPFISPHTKEFFLGSDLKSTEDYRHYTTIGGTLDNKRIYRANNGAEYVELQYWGKVTMNDVKAFYFCTHPPTGKFLERLQELGIKIYDFTNERPIPYKPGASEIAK